MILRPMRRAIAWLRSERAPARPPRDVPPPTFAREVAAREEDAAEWLAAQRRARPLYVDLDDAAVAAVASRCPCRAADTIAAANRILAHEFDLLGSGPFVPCDPHRAAIGGYQPIDWSLDPIRGLRFPEGFQHRDWKFDTMRPGNADIKLPWELGRCQHFATLGQAWRLTADARYGREIVDEIRDFTEVNPPGVGVQWTCTMDVGLRAVSWSIGLSLIATCDAIGDREWLDAYRALFDHGTFIENNLENTYEVTSNHFLSNVLGLHVLGYVFAGLPSAARWRRQCRDWLEQEMRVQVLDDGADYESSVPYHRLVAELFLGAARLAAWHREPLSEAYTARLRRMIDYLASVQRPDGLMPVVGDADDGRLHILSEYGRWNPQDSRHLVAAAGAFFESAEWMTRAGAALQWEAAWWGLAQRSDLTAVGVPDKAVQHFPLAGITLLQTADAWVLITNGRVGTNGFGNHKHNDQLAFEYHVGGAPVIVDAGSYVYTADPASRNLFRGTGYHNTLSIDGVEQNELRAEWLFRLFETSNAEHLAVADRAGVLEYVGRHSGYRRLPDPVTHTRRFRLRGRVLTITDFLEGRGAHTARWHFHFAPTIAVTLIEPGLFEVRAGTETITLASPRELTHAIGPAWVSPSYGVRVPCVAIEFALHATPLPDRPTEYLFTFA